MSRSEPLGARLRYAFDKSMAKGTVALVGWLAFLSLAVIVVAGGVLVVAGIGPGDGEPSGFLESVWQSLMRTFDAGTMGADEGWNFRIVMLVVTLAGIFLVAALIGVLSAGLDGKIAELRKGHSRALETDHTIILNWSPAIFDIMSELAVANESRKRPRIVILAAHDKVEMEDEIKGRELNLGKTKVICRSGEPTDVYDLALANPQASRSIIVLSPEGEDPDSQVIKSVLAIVHDRKRRATPYSIAAEIREPGNVHIARSVGGSEVQVVLADDLIARVVANSIRQTGLSHVYVELLDFAGCEIYTVPQPQLVGKSFDYAVMAYENSTPIGVCDGERNVQLNPPGPTIIGEGDRLVIVAEDDSTIAANPDRCTFDEQVIREPQPISYQPERTLVVGWNRRGPIVIRELSRFVAPGSLVTIAADTPEIEHEIAVLKTVISEKLEIQFRRINTANHSELDSLDVTSYNHVLVLGYSDLLKAQSADTQTLIALLHLRKIVSASNSEISVVGEMTDIRNRQLAEVTRADDFVVSNQLVSLMLAQASENDAISSIFDDLLDEDGAELYLRPVTDYITIGKPTTFYTIAEAARRGGQVALGYRLVRNGEQGKEVTVVVNPVKSDAVRFEKSDLVVVLSQD